MVSRNDQIREKLSRLVQQSRGAPSQQQDVPDNLIETPGSTRTGRGPQKSPTKVPISIRLDRDLVEALRASGRGWQSRLNDWLRVCLETSAAEDLLGRPKQDDSPDHGHHKRAPEG